MKVLIVEDEQHTADRLQAMLLRYDSNLQIAAQLPSVSATLRFFERPDAGVDLIFLDIHLEDGLGFKILDELKLSIPVIFTTAFNEYALRAFKTFSIDYLLKPIDYAELCAAMDKLKKMLTFGASLPSYQPVADSFHKTQLKDRFLVSIGTRLQSIPVSQIAYFCYEHKATFLVTDSGQHFGIDYSLERLVDVLDTTQFFRVNRSFVVSLSSIQSIDTYSQGKLKLALTPAAGQEVFVSADRISAFKHWLGK